MQQVKDREAKCQGQGTGTGRNIVRLSTRFFIKCYNLGLFSLQLEAFPSTRRVSEQTTLKQASEVQRVCVCYDV